MANASTWTRGHPSGASLLRDFDDLYRSDKSILEASLLEEHYWQDGSTASAGRHKLGSARIYSGASSEVSATGEKGRLMWDETNTQLVALHAATTTRLPGLAAANTWSGAQTFSAQITSTLATGTAPFAITSTTLVANLNADLLDGQHASAFALAGHAHSAADITSGTLASARLSGSYTGVTAVGTLSSLSVSGASALTGNVGVGGSSIAAVGLFVLPTLNGGTTQAGISSATTFGSGTTVLGVGTDSQVKTTAAAFTMPEAAAYRARNPVIGAGSAITTAYGLYVENLTAGSANYAIYTAGTTQSYFGGQVQVGGMLSLEGNAVFQPTGAATTSQVQALIHNPIYTTAGGRTSVAKVELIRTSAAADQYDGEIRFHTRNTGAALTERMRLNASGNLGIGTTDIEAVGSGFGSLQIGSRTHLLYGTSGEGAHYSQNAYWDGAWKYRVAATAVRYAQGSGEHIFFVAPAGSIDTAIGWTTALTIANSGAATFSNALTAASLNLGGATMTDVLSTTFVWDPPSIGAHNGVSTTVTVNGAEVGDMVMVTNPWLNTFATVHTYAMVSAANTVHVQAWADSNSSTDPPSATLRIVVLKF